MFFDPQARSLLFAFKLFALKMSARSMSTRATPQKPVAVPVLQAVKNKRKASASSTSQQNPPTAPPQVPTNEFVVQSPEEHPFAQSHRVGNGTGPFQRAAKAMQTENRDQASEGSSTGNALAK